MAAPVDVEELNATSSERLLAAVLAIFLLVGTVWFYVKVPDWVDSSQDRQPTTSQSAILDERDQSWERQADAQQSLDDARVRFDIAKANIDVASGGETAVPDETTEAFEAARDEVTAANTELNESIAATRKADEAAQQVESELYGQPRSTSAQWTIALIRFGFIGLWMIGSLAAFNRVRTNKPRYTPLALAAVATGAVMTLVFATDYITDYIDPLDLGPLVLSGLGVVVTLAAFTALQRWIAARLPARRVRNGECPFCGYPVRDEAGYCEGCGHVVRTQCGSCAGPRRIGSAHCPTCGAA